MKPSDHVPTPEIDEIAGFKKKKNVIKPTKFCPFKYAKFWYFFEGKFNEDMPNKCAQSFSDFTLAGQSPLVALSRLQTFQEVSKYVYINKRQVYGHTP